MAKKRYVSQDLLFSESIGLLSDFAECTFTRLLLISDDFGVIPPISQICKRIAYEGERKERFPAAWKEILEAGLLLEIEYEGKTFFMFKPDSFDQTQTHITNRTKSEYLGVKCRKRAEFDTYIIYLKLNKKYPAKDKDIVKDKAKGEGMQGEGPESESEKCFRLIREVRSTAEEPGKIMQFEERQIRGYASQYGEKVLKAIERLANIDWRCTPDQILKVIQGKLNPETVHERTNRATPTTLPRKELRAPTPKEEPQKEIASPDEVAKILGETGMKFLGGILPKEALPQRKGLKPLTELLPQTTE